VGGRAWFAITVVGSLLTAGLTWSTAHAVSGPSADATTARYEIGGPCPKVGLKRTIRGVPVTCRKAKVQGKKRLVWVADKPGPSPTPTPTPTSPPTPSPTPSPTPTPAVRPQWLAELDSGSHRWVYEDVSTRLAAMEMESTALDVRVTPNFPSELADGIIANYSKIGSFWSDVARPRSPVIVRLGTELDLDWWRSQIGQWPQMYKAIEETYARSGAFANSANSYTEGSQFHHQFVFGTQIPAEAQRHAKSVTVPHEYTHSIQAAVAGNLGMLPCWFMEGHANVYGVTVGAPDKESYEAERIRTLRRELPMSGAWPASSPDVIARALASGESRQGYQCPRSGYSIGMLAVEALVAVYGHATVSRFMDATRTQQWKAAFQETYGMEPSRFYSEVAAFVIASGQSATSSRSSLTPPE
jgi:hypothetical protein